MIKGHCFTRLDGYDGEYWPNEFVAVPRLGESVMSSNGRVLKVVIVTHWMADAEPGYSGTAPMIRVELSQ